MGVTRQVVDRLLADRTFAFRRLPGNSTAAGLVMSFWSPRNVIVAKGERALFAAHCESLPMGVSTDLWTRPNSVPA